MYCFLIATSCFAKNTGFTQEDRERLVRLEATLQVFMQQVDKRFEQVDKRFAELREDMNKRFEEVINFLWMLVAIFTTLTAAVIGFAYWNRRTIIRKARDEAIETIEKQGRIKDLIMALRTVAKEDKRFATVLRSFGLL